MIRYKCSKCKIKLETDNSFSGQLDTCPGCGEVNLAPLSKKDKIQVKKARRAKKREEKLIARTKKIEKFNQRIAVLSDIGKVPPTFGTVKPINHSTNDLGWLNKLIGDAIMYYILFVYMSLFIILVLGSLLGWS